LTSRNRPTGGLSRSALFARYRLTAAAAAKAAIAIVEAVTSEDALRISTPTGNGAAERLQGRNGGHGDYTRSARARILGRS
jgi:cobalamin biosynthesis protein CbiD